MGIHKYLQGLNGQKSRMKTYVSQPTAIEEFIEQDVHILQMDTGRRHMIALGYYRQGRPLKPYSKRPKSGGSKRPKSGGHGRGKTKN